VQVVAHTGRVATRLTAARPTFVRAALVAGLALVAAQSGAHMLVTLGGNIGFGEADSAFDLDKSNGIPDVVSTLLLVAAAVGAVVLAGKNRFGRSPAALAAALFVVATADALHTGNGTVTYRLIVIATLLVTGALATWVALRTRGATRACIFVGLALLVLDVKAPYLYDQLMNAVGQPALRRGDFLYELGVVLDEGMELMGWVLVAVGLWGAALAPRAAIADARLDVARDLGPPHGGALR